MAKVNFGAGGAEIRGSIGGMTYSRNSSGAIIRNKVTPVNPRTVFQSVVRAIFALVAAAWNGLSDEQRATWNANAPDVPNRDVFGNNVPLTGQQLFNKWNGLLQQLGFPIVNTCIGLAPIPDPTFDTIEVLVGDDEMNITNLAATNSTNAIAIYATAPQSVGKKAPSRSAYRLIHVKGNNIAAGDLDVNGDYQAKFGFGASEMVGGGNVFFAFRRVLTDRGSGSPTSVAKVSITP